MIAHILATSTLQRDATKLCLWDHAMAESSLLLKLLFLLHVLLQDGLSSPKLAACICDHLGADPQHLVDATMGALLVRCKP